MVTRGKRKVPQQCFFLDGRAAWLWQDKAQPEEQVGLQDPSSNLHPNIFTTKVSWPEGSKAAHIHHTLAPRPPLQLVCWLAPSSLLLLLLWDD